jgi:hypothetical protein
MAVHISESIKTAKKWDLEFISGQMVVNTGANGRITKLME